MSVIDLRKRAACIREAALSFEGPLVDTMLELAAELEEQSDELVRSSQTVRPAPD